jgi:hypothetical protein
LIRFLETFKFFTLVVVLVSTVVFTVFAFIAVLFCDAGPASACFRFAGGLLAVPVAEIGCLIGGWVLLKKQRHLYVCAAMMVAASLPLPIIVVWFLMQKR